MHYMPQRGDLQRSVAGQGEYDCCDVWWRDGVANWKWGSTDKGWPTTTTTTTTTYLIRHQCVDLVGQRPQRDGGLRLGRGTHGQPQVLKGPSAAAAAVASGETSAADAFVDALAAIHKPRAYAGT